jgi:hypothetical protein
MAVHHITARERHILEGMLLIVCLGLTCLLYTMHGYKMVILNLFFLPVALGGFFLGRYRAGVLALFCAVCASLVIASQLRDLSLAASPLVVALAVAVWAAVLGLTAMLIGVLSDDRARKVSELHEAYVGVVEVLSQYLQGAQPRLKARSIQVAELSQAVAAAMRLSPRQIDDIRVAALLYDVGNIEVTTRVIRRAVNTFEGDPLPGQQATFQGMDLMLSLGTVLSGAVPLLLNQHQDAAESPATGREQCSADVPIGAKVIRTVRAYLAMAEASAGSGATIPAELIQQLRSDGAAGHEPDVVDALAHVVLQRTRAAMRPVEEDAVLLGEAAGEPSANFVPR